MMPVAPTFNDRQRLMLNKLMDGFEGKLTSSKWAKIAECSQDTATRDIQDLVNKRILVKDEAGSVYIQTHIMYCAKIILYVFAYNIVNLLKFVAKAYNNDGTFRFCKAKKKGGKPYTARVCRASGCCTDGNQKNRAG